MTGSWFRFYSAVLHDPKVQQLCDSAYRGWTALLCVACENDGIIPKKLDHIAFSLRLSESKTSALINSLKSAGLLDVVDGGYQPHNWNGRQYKSDVSTERVKRFRERSKTVSETPPDQSRSETDQNRTDSFADFWRVFPKQVQEQKAKAAYAIAAGKAEPEKIIAGAQRFARKVKSDKTEDKFIAAPHTWLAACRWTEGETNGAGATHLSAEEIANQNRLLAAHDMPLIGEDN